MPRRTHDIALSIRYRNGSHINRKFGTRLVLRNSPTTFSGKTLSVSKFSKQEADKVGEYWKPFQDNDPESKLLRSLVRP